MPLVFAAAALALAIPLSAASASALDGTWHITGNIEGNPVNPICVFAEKDAKLTGTCTGTDGKPLPLTGTVDDKSVKWQYDTAYQGTPITLFFTATLDKEDHVTGGIYIEPFAVNGDFTATKDKSDPSAKPLDKPADKPEDKSGPPKVAPPPS